MIGIQTWPENPLVIVIISLLVLAVIAAAALISNKIQKKKKFIRSRTKIADFPHQYQNYQPEINLIKRMVRTVQSPGLYKIPAPVQKEIDIFDGKRDITQSLLALVEKYSLDTFTIATSDGLVFASSGGDDANTNAATYSVMTLQDPWSDTTTVLVQGLTHKDSALVGIIRTQNPVSEEILTRIAQDTQAILNWWV